MLKKTYIRNGKGQIIGCEPLVSTTAIPWSAIAMGKFWAGRAAGTTTHEMRTDDL